MWLKNFNEIAQRFFEDGKFHDVQIVNNKLYIDGKLTYVDVNQAFQDVQTFDRVLSREETELLYNQSRTLSEIEYPLRLCVELLSFSMWNCKKTEEMKYSEIRKLLLQFFNEDQIAKAQDILIGKWQSNNPSESDKNKSIGEYEEKQLELLKQRIKKMTINFAQ